MTTQPVQCAIPVAASDIDCRTSPSPHPIATGFSSLSHPSLNMQGLILMLSDAFRVSKPHIYFPDSESKEKLGKHDFS